MNRRYIRESAVVGFYQYLLNLDSDISNFEIQTNGKSDIKVDTLQKHKKNYKIQHYIELTKDSDSYVETLEEFIKNYDKNFDFVHEKLKNLNKQIITDSVVFVQLLNKLKKCTDLNFNEKVKEWIDKVNDELINKLSLSYEDFWIDKSFILESVHENILQNSENIINPQNFIELIINNQLFYEYLESIDIEWEYNMWIFKKKVSSNNFVEVLINEDPDFDSYNLFYKKLIDAAIDNFETLNEEIKKHILNWDMDRIGMLDKSILMIAIGEHLYVNELPKQIIINEYLEIAKKISRIDSSTFINGILDKALN